MISQRDTIFIGHANPEDNEFTLWLYHKLSNEGYTVACDLVNLIGGESDFWKSLQDILEYKTCKYLLVFTKSAFQKQGVIDEWEQVRAIAKKANLSDFIYILKIDDVAFDARIGTVTMNQFRFDKSWANGLRQLTKKLYLDKVPKASSPLSMNDWLKNRYTSHVAGLKKKKEKYHSNWVEILSLPQVIYFYRYANDTQANAICEEVDSYPIIQHDNYLITFLDSLPTETLKHGLTIESKEKISVSTNKCFEYYEEKEFPDFHDLRRFLVRLLKASFRIHFGNRGLSIYELSGNNNCYFYSKDILPDDRVVFEFEGKQTRKDLVGHYHESFWHYGISIKPLFQPFFCVAMKGHLVFSNDGKATWADKDKQHAARRAKGKRFFNKEWRAMLLAFLQSISKDGVISIPANETIEISISSEPIVFYGDVGYDDPKEKAREVPIDYIDDDGDSDETFETEYEDEE